MDRNVSDIEEIIRKLLLWFITMIEVGATNEIIITWQAENKKKKALFQTAQLNLEILAQEYSKNC